MQAKGQGKPVEYNHDISNCPHMIAKFSKINLTSAPDQESDTEDNQEYVSFYEEELWLGREQESPLPKINNICAEPILNLSNQPSHLAPTQKQPEIYQRFANSSILLINPNDNKLQVSTVAVSKAPLMRQNCWLKHSRKKPNVR